MNKINIFSIVFDHIKTLRNNRTQKFSWTDGLIFFGLPLVVASVLVFFDKTVDEDARNIFGITLSVLAGLLFNMLLLVHNITKGFEHDTVVRQRYVKEVYFNLAFSVSVAILTLVILVTTVFLAGEVARWLSGAVFYLSSVFVLTLIMVLRRLHILFSDQFGSL